MDTRPETSVELKGPGSIAIVYKDSFHIEEEGREESDAVCICTMECQTKYSLVLIY